MSDPTNGSSSSSSSSSFLLPGAKFLGLPSREEDDIIDDDPLVIVENMSRLEFVDVVDTPGSISGSGSGIGSGRTFCRTCRSRSSLSNSSHQSSVSVSAAAAICSAGCQPNHTSAARSFTCNKNGMNGSLTDDTYVHDDDDVMLLQEDDCVRSRVLDDLDHCHFHNPVQAQSRKARNQLIISSVLCLLFMIAEVIGGYFSNSLAIMTDAAHLLSDFTSFLISLFAIWMGNRPATQKMSFGYYRAEILGAMVSVMIIWVLTGVLVYLAVLRVIYQDYTINADTMLIVSGVGVMMNIIMGLVLHSMCQCHTHSHGIGSSHGHGHSHGGEDKQNINVRAALIHVMGDLLQSVGVLIAAYVIKYKPEYHLADPICTFLFSALVVFTTINIMKDAVYVLMEGFPRDVKYEVIKNDLQSIEGVAMVHSLHIWSLTLDKNTLNVHLAIENSADTEKILKLANRLVRAKYHIYQSTIQVEPYNAMVMTNCNQCIGPQT